MLPMKKSVLSLKEKQYNLGFPTFKLQVLNIFYNSPVKYYAW